MLTQSKLEKIFNAVGVSVYKTNYTLDFDSDILLESDDIETFVQFVKENNVKSVFFSFRYIEADDFLIIDDDIPALNDVLRFRPYPIGVEEKILNTFQDYFKHKQTEFNKNIDNNILKGPIAVHVYCMFNGASIGFLETDSSKLNLPDKKEVLMDLKYYLENMVETEINQERQKKDKQAEEMLQLACKHLDESDDWKACTNQRLRRAYCKQLMENFEKEYGVEPSFFELETELEMRWNKYKANKKTSQS